MALKWRDQLSVGNEVIDADHKQLIENLNQVEKYIEIKNKRGLTTSLDNLYQFYKKHSASELKIAGAVSYPQVSQLKACHEELLKSLEQVRSELISEPTPTESTQSSIAGFNSFVKDWLTNEVIKENLPLKPFLAKRSPMFDPR